MGLVTRSGVCSSGTACVVIIGGSTVGTPGGGVFLFLMGTPTFGARGAFTGGTSGAFTGSTGDALGGLTGGLGFRGVGTSDTYGSVADETGVFSTTPGNSSSRLPIVSEPITPSTLSPLASW